MDAKRITRALWAVVVLWLLSATVVAERAAAGEPALPPAINLILFLGLSTTLLGLLLIRSHVGLAGRNTRVEEGVETLNSGLDRRDAVMYRDFNRRVDHVHMRLDDMTAWMMRPAVPKGPVRVSAAAATTSLKGVQEQTAALSVLSLTEEAELRGFLARECTETDEN